MKGIILLITKLIIIILETRAFCENDVNLNDSYNLNPNEDDYDLNMNETTGDWDQYHWNINMLS